MASTDPSHLFNARPATPDSTNELSYDLICVGFGPAQIATAIANRESKKPCRVLFLEKKAAFSWKPSAHLPRTRMENAFVYDLVTARNPRSAFTYTSYLLAKGRLIAFANSDRLQPLREEFEDYLGWCAEQFKEQVRYGHEVVAVMPDYSNDMVKNWHVVVKDLNGRTQTFRTNNIVTPGPTRSEQKTWPLTSVNFEAGQRIVSFDDYSNQRDQLRVRREPRRDIAVVGSGSKTLEIVDDLLASPSLGNVTVVTESESFAPLRILDNEATAPQPRLCSLWAKPSCDTHSALSDAPELIQSIYGRAYEKQVASKGQYALRIVMARDRRDAAEPTSRASIIIAENTVGAQLGPGALFDQLDGLVLGCRQKGESLEEVQFKRGAVVEGCHMWMLNGHSSEGRSLAKDIAVRAGDISTVLATTAGSVGTHNDAEGRQVVISARM